MRRPAPLLVLVFALACAGSGGAVPPPLPISGGASVLHAAELARIRCLVVAPFENTSDAPNASETAAGALSSAMNPARVEVFPVDQLRTLFRDTPLELPQGIGPSLALELGEIVGADAVLYGSVEGRSQEASPELLVTLRLSLTHDRRLLFADSVLVTPASAERTDAAVRRAVVAAAGPALARLGNGGKRRCFGPERTKALRQLALSEAPEPPRAPPFPAPRPPAPPPVASPPPAAGAAPASAPLRTGRQAEWARRLEEGDRIVVEELSFAGRSADLQREGGLPDLAAVLLARPAVSVRLEAFVDATEDRAGDRRLSHAMARAAADRLAELGVPRQRVLAAGRGGESPRLPNFTLRGRAANRRVEAVAAP